MQIRKFDPKVNKVHWGSIDIACRQVLDLEKPLRRFWDLERYDAAGQDVAAPGAEARLQLEGIDEAIESPVFWARLIAFDFLFEMIRG